MDGKTDFYTGFLSRFPPSEPPFRLILPSGIRESTRGETLNKGTSTGNSPNPLAGVHCLARLFARARSMDAKDASPRLRLRVRALPGYRWRPL